VTVLWTVFLGWAASHTIVWLFGLLATTILAKTSERTALQVMVRDNNVDQALRVLKKKMQREGVFREMKQRSHYEKPSERKVREHAEAVRRARKAARKQAIREGLIAARKRPERPTRPGQPVLPSQTG
jgi:small subunit ribosomal protein S21